MFIQLLSFFSILFTFTLLIYWPFLHHFKQGAFIERTKPYIVGLKFGFSGLIFTIVGLELMSGFMVNSRIILVLFSGLLGGPISLLISGLIMGIGRLFLDNLTTVTYLLNLNFTALTIVLFLFTIKYELTRQSIFIYFWAALVDGIIVLFIGLTIHKIGFFYLMVYTIFTVFTFYFIYFVIHQVKRSNDTVQETHYLQYIDYQTKLSNNFAIQPHIENLITKKIDFTMLLIDIKDFRLVNSLYGFPVGDAIIKQLGLLFCDYAQKNDVIIGRIGGEEFLVVLKNVAPAVAIVEANQFIQAIAQHSFVGPKNTEIRISVSVGLCSYPTNGEDMHTLTKKLILAQQHAKANSISSYFHASNLK
ncbi:MAG: diguanylate cyclase [Solibacillus sp.]|uniref:diguanylate cyclase n=1 Tax=unclassified Solibacillus TaxID=2637870 RepID=UPI00310145BB